MTDITFNYYPHFFTATTLEWKRLLYALVGLAAAVPLQVLSPATVAWASVYLQRFSKLPGLGAQPIVH